MDSRELWKEQIVIMDGAMGTYYSSLYDKDEEIAEWSNIKNPDRIVKIHREYLEAGATLLRTNTFAINSVVMGVNQRQQQELIQAGYRLASQAVEEYGVKTGKKAYIAADIGPIPMHGEVTEEDIIVEYRNICDAFLEVGASIFLFETFSSMSMIKEAILYLKEQNPNVSIITNFCVNKNGYTTAGISARKILDEIMQMEQITAGGFNCGIGSGHMLQLLKELELPRSITKPIAILPNAGYPEQLHNRMVFRNNTKYFGENMTEIQKLGISIMGGCCGTTPDYIKVISQIQRQDTNDIIVRIPSREVDLQKSEEITNQEVNTFYEKLMAGNKVIAVELDPPFDNQDEKILDCVQRLKDTKADIVTIADSPMGRSRVDSVLMSIKLMKQCGANVMPHICCRDKNMIAMRSMLLGAYLNDIRNLLVVTGDPVPSEQRLSTTNVFDYNSIQLMQFIKQMNEEHFKDHPFRYGGALNPGLGRIDKIIERMNRKIEAGASYFLTQPIYTEENIERIQYIKEHVDTKILCGIMPFVSYRNANFIKNEFTGIHVPDEIVNRYTPQMSKEEAEVVGVNLGIELVNKLYPYADGFYFMLPFNRISLFEQIQNNPSSLL